jgi:hypothetical protein
MDGIRHSASGSQHGGTVTGLRRGGIGSCSMWVSKMQLVSLLLFASAHMLLPIAS